MVITGLLFAERAEVTDQGHLNVVNGVWNWIGTRGADGQTPHPFTLVALVQADSDSRQGAVSVEVSGPDGEPVGIVEGSQRVILDDEQGFAIINVAITVAALGRYVFRATGTTGGSIAVTLDVREFS